MGVPVGTPFFVVVRAVAKGRAPRRWCSVLSAAMHLSSVHPSMGDKSLKGASVERLRGYHQSAAESRLHLSAV